MQKSRQLVIAILCVMFSAVAQAQNTVKSELFNRAWTSPYATTFHSGQPLESAFPNGFTMTLDKNMIYRYSYVTYPGNPSDTFTKAIDTFDLTKKFVSYSKAGRKVESTASLSSDKKTVNFVRTFYSATDPTKLEFTYYETFKVLDDGSVVLEKEGTATDPNSNFIFVGEKKYPYDYSGEKKKQMAF